MAEEAVEEAVQNVAGELNQYGKLDEGTLGRTVEAAVLGALGGGMMGGAGMAINAGKSKIAPPNAGVNPNINMEQAIAEAQAMNAQSQPVTNPALLRNTPAPAVATQLSNNPQNVSSTSGVVATPIQNTPVTTPATQPTVNPALLQTPQTQAVTTNGMSMPVPETDVSQITPDTVPNRSSFSIQKGAAPDGSDLVNVDNTIFDGVPNNSKAKTEALKNYLKSLSNQDLGLNYGEDGAAKITNRGIKEVSRTGTINTRGKVAGNLDEVLQVSKVDPNKAWAPDEKNRSFAKDGFEYRTSYVQVGDEVYRVRSNIALEDGQKTFHTLNRYDKESTPAQLNRSLTGSSGDTSMNNSIPQHLKKDNNQNETIPSNIDVTNMSNTGNNVTGARSNVNNKTYAIPDNPQPSQPPITSKNSSETSSETNPDYIINTKSLEKLAGITGKEDYATAMDKLDQAYEDGEVNKAQATLIEDSLFERYKRKGEVMEESTKSQKTQPETAKTNKNLLKKDTSAKKIADAGRAMVSGNKKVEIGAQKETKGAQKESIGEVSGDRYTNISQKANSLATKPTVDTTYLDKSNPNLTTPKQKQLEQTFTERVKRQPKRYINKYIKENTNESGATIINIDNARDLFREYKASKKFRQQNTDTTSTPASFVAYEAYKQKLSELKNSGKQEVVTFTGGIPSAGKSEALRQFSNPDSHLVYDSNLANFNNAKDIIDKALEAGQDVDVFYVYRDPVDAYKSAVSRAEATGRTVPYETTLKNYINSKDTVKQLIEHYGDKIDLTIADNNVAEGTFDEITPVDFYNKFTYNEDTLSQELRRIHDQSTTQSLHSTDTSTDAQEHSGSPSSGRVRHGLTKETGKLTKSDKPVSAAGVQLELVKSEPVRKLDGLMKTAEADTTTSPLVKPDKTVTDARLLKQEPADSKTDSVSAKNAQTDEALAVGEQNSPTESGQSTGEEHMPYTRQTKAVKDEVNKIIYQEFPELAYINEQGEFVGEVPKIRKSDLQEYYGKNLKSSELPIPRSYITNDPNALPLDVLAQNYYTDNGMC
jgi:hypothetical protein